jgi:hypothetical protein
MSYPNSVWTVDSEGQFKTLDGEWCYPLTLLDRFLGYCLARVELWHIRIHACNIDGIAVGRALAAAGLQSGQIAVVAHANVRG